MKNEYVLYKTDDYSIFSFIKGNRKINNISLNRLIESMRDEYVFSAITVNENMQIIDGQHRFLAQKELNIPIYYIIINGYSQNQIHRLNTNGSNWKKTDYLKGYTDLGNRNYIQFGEFMQMFPEIGIKAALTLCSRTDKDRAYHNSDKDFESGKLKINDLEYSKILASIVMDFKPFYIGFARNSFVLALCKIYSNSQYVHDEMMAKLSRRKDQITHQINMKNYLIQLEDIYNFNRRKKVNLRY